MVNSHPLKTSVKRLLISPLYRFILSQRLKPKTFDFSLLFSANQIGFLKSFAHFSMYYTEPESLERLTLYPGWQSGTRTLEEWNSSAPKRKKPLQPPRAEKEKFWEYQYLYSLYSYEHTNYERDKLQASLTDPALISQIVSFIQNHQRGWHLPPPWIGTSFDTVILDILFFRGEEFLGSVGLKDKNTLCILLKGKKKQYAQQYIREISDEDSLFLFKVAGINMETARS